jgi:pyruvoyl-dependent arginine decarboxylase (PvlArgDC)
MSQHAQVQQNLQRIDGQLDALVDITAQGRIVATSIGSELDDQNRMLGEVGEHMDKTQDEVDKAVAKTVELKMTGSNWAGWICVVLLIAAIIVVWVVPKH